MTAAQLDPQTGLLAWPRLLLRREYADLRRALDGMFSDRASVGGAIGSDTYEGILEHIDEMTDRLTARIRSANGPNGVKDHIDARSFLKSLESEMGFAPGSADE
jgi:hypothetical protein